MDDRDRLLGRGKNSERQRHRRENNQHAREPPSRENLFAYLTECFAIRRAERKVARTALHQARRERHQAEDDCRADNCDVCVSNPRSERAVRDDAHPPAHFDLERDDPQQCAMFFEHRGAERSPRLHFSCYRRGELRR